MTKQTVAAEYLRQAKEAAIRNDGTATDLFVLAEVVESCTDEEFALYFEGMKQETA